MYDHQSNWTNYQYPPQNSTYTDLVRGLRARSLPRIYDDEDVNKERHQARACSVGPGNLTIARSASPFCDRPSVWGRVGPCYSDLDHRIDNYLERSTTRNMDGRSHLTWSRYNSPLCYGWPYSYYSEYYRPNYSFDYSYTPYYGKYSLNKSYEVGPTYHSPHSPYSYYSNMNNYYNHYNKDKYLYNL